MAFAEDQALVNLFKASEVEDYLYDHVLASDQQMAALLERIKHQPVPFIHVPPDQGKLLKLLIQLMGAQRVLEIGTLVAYSTIWMAQGLPPGGKIITLDFDAQHARLARDNIEFAGFSEQIEVIEGDAVSTLGTMIDEGVAPFDFIFIDADKGNNPTYLELCLQLSRSGTVIVADNVVRQGKIIDPTQRGANIHGLRRFFEMIKENPAVDATALQTVGAKNWDGFALLRVK